jgi:Holliday junction resolvase RusA-like endonuclease
LKVLCDALQHAGVIGNDSQFREIVVSFEETKPGGELRIEIRRLSLSQKGHA